MVMKVDVLRVVEGLGQSTASQVASWLLLSYHEVAVALLRCQRSGLVERSRSSSTEPYSYEITPRGVKRLQYLDALAEEQEDAQDEEDDDDE